MSKSQTELLNNVQNNIAESYVENYEYKLLKTQPNSLYFYLLTTYWLLSDLFLQCFKNQVQSFTAHTASLLFIKRTFYKIQVPPEKVLELLPV